MITYKNKRLNSGVKAYFFGHDFILVKFNDGYYLYSYEKPGQNEVEEMKQRTNKGEKLSEYISKYIGKRYEKMFKTLEEMENYLEKRLVKN